MKEGRIRIVRAPMIRDEELIDHTTPIITRGLDYYDIIIVDNITPLIKLLKDYASKRAWI